MSGLSIRASSQDGVAVIEVLNGSTTLAFLGASCPASAIPGNDGLSSITLSPNKGEEAVVALTTYTRYGGKNPDISAGGLIRLRWEGDKLFVDTDKLFISLADRLGQVVPNGRILLVRTQGQMFGLSIAEPQYRDKYERVLLMTGDDLRIVHDANLLCRYLVGRATFEELEAVAVEDYRTADEKRIAELEEVVRAEKERTARVQESLRDHWGKLISFRRTSERLARWLALWKKNQSP